MKTLSLTMRAAAILLLGSAFGGMTTVEAAVIPAPANGLEVMARGPLHEAFAVPSTTQPGPAPVLSRQPPPDLEELPPDQKPEGNNVQWLRGYWAWDNDNKDFVWVSGIWRDIPPGRQWVPGYWTRLADSWQWVSGFWAEAGVQDFSYLPQPPASPESGPSLPAPDDTSGYVPGNWVYRQSRYWWQPGTWVAYRPDWIWCPARYVWTPAGYVYVPGYWDYPLARRGLLFAPVCFSQPLWTSPGWYYQPSYTVAPDFLLGNLFVQPNYGSYYFGDYYGPTYAALGFVPWMDNRIGRYAYDPLFNYYGSQNGGNPGWANNQRALYAGRRAGTVPVPPRTLAQQNRLTGDPRVAQNPGRLQQMTALTPLAQANRSAVPLQRITAAQQRAERDRSRQVQNFSQQRAKTEAGTRTLATPNRGTNGPHVVRPELPAQPSKSAGTSAAPPALHSPKTTATEIRPAAPTVTHREIKPAAAPITPKALHTPIPAAASKMPDHKAATPVSHPVARPAPHVQPAHHPAPAVKHTASRPAPVVHTAHRPAPAAHKGGGKKK